MTIEFYTHADGSTYYFNDDARDTAFIVADRPADEDDYSAYPDAYAAFTAQATPAPAPAPETSS